MIVGPHAERLSWPLIGRDDELAFARRRLEERGAGGLIVAGDPGVGKTRLATEITAAAVRSGREVRTVRATRSAASIALGAFAALLPAPEPAAGLAELLARARHALRASGEPIVLCIDDAHLLDDVSATLAHQLVAAGDAFVVATIRQGETAPDAVQALWKDELCALVRLGPLERETLERLAHEALGDPLDGRSLNLLWELTRGNALFVRELIHHGIEHGALADDGGIWRWRGDTSPGLRLSELVAARLADLPPQALDVLELVAVGCAARGRPARRRRDARARAARATRPRRARRRRAATSRRRRASGPRRGHPSASRAHAPGAHPAAARRCGGRPGRAAADGRPARRRVAA